MSATIESLFHDVNDPAERRYVNRMYGVHLGKKEDATHYTTYDSNAGEQLVIVLDGQVYVWKNSVEYWKKCPAIPRDCITPLGQKEPVYQRKEIEIVSKPMTRKDYYPNSRAGD